VIWFLIWLAMAGYALTGLASLVSALVERWCSPAKVEAAQRVWKIGADRPIEMRRR
jgi:hypothetical protein